MRMQERRWGVFAVKLQMVLWMAIVLGCSHHDDDDPPPVTSSSQISSVSSSSISSAASSSSLANLPPAVSLGPDRVVTEEQRVRLIAQVSDPEGEDVSVTWRQVSGPGVSWDSSSETATWVILPTDSEYSIEFEAQASDPLGATAVDTIIITKYRGGVRVLTAVGQPAPGFSNATVANLLAPSINSNGQVALFGGVSFGSSATDVASVLWRGDLGDDFEPLVQTEDRIAGAASSERFSLGVGTPVINGRGDILFRGYLAGLGASEAVMVYRDGQAERLLQVGERAPGFSSSDDLASVERIAFSLAGAVILGTTDTGIQALWFWDYQQLHLVAAASSQSSQYSRVDEARALHYGSNCFFMEVNVSNALDLQVNDWGQILFATVYTGSGANAQCPYDRLEYISWRDGTFYPLVTDEQAVPNLIGYEFRLAENYDRMVLLPSGQVAVTTKISDQSAALDELNTSNWLFGIEQAEQLITMAGEEFEDGSTEIGAPQSSFGIGSYPSEAGQLCTVVPEEITGDATVLRGQARPNPYTSLNNLGENPMDVLVRVGDSAPGGGDIGSIDYFTSTINGSIILVGARRGENLAGDNEAVFWHGSTRDNFIEVLASLDEVEYDGEENPVHSFGLVARPWGSGLPSQASDNGIIAFNGVWGIQEAIMVFVPDRQ